MLARNDWSGSARSPVPFILRGGSVVALPTPFRNGKVDEDALATLCLRQVAAGTHGLAVCGTTGEAPALSHVEQRRVIEVAVRAAQGRVPVIAGAGGASTATTVELAAQAEEAGAAALLCVTPYYVRPTQEGLFRHMKAIHDAVRIPLILYDVPARTGCVLGDETLLRISQLQRVIGLKDAASDVGRVARLRSRLPQGFLMLSGDDATQAQYRRNGGDGCISVTANIVPAFCVEMHNAFDNGDRDTFYHAAEMLMPLNRALFIESNPTPLKYALALMGLIRNELRLPLVPLSQHYEESVRVSLQQLSEIEQGGEPAAETSTPIHFRNVGLFADRKTT